MAVNQLRGSLSRQIFFSFLFFFVISTSHVQAPLPFGIGIRVERSLQENVNLRFADLSFFFYYTTNKLSIYHQNWMKENSFSSAYSYFLLSPFWKIHNFIFFFWTILASVHSCYKVSVHSLLILMNWVAQLLPHLLSWGIHSICSNKCL